MAESRILSIEELVLFRFPEKVSELDDLLRSDTFNKHDMSALHSEVNIPVPTYNEHKDGTESHEPHVSGASTKAIVFPNGPVPSNRHLVEIIEILKPWILQLIEDANVVKMWIQLQIPKIEDGNNFGVSVQETVLSKVKGVENKAGTFFDQISWYFHERGKAVSKLAKYPCVDDYRRNIQEIDEKMFVSLRVVLRELRNHYTTLHDVIGKNMEKLKKPRSTAATESLYCH